MLFIAGYIGLVKPDLGVPDGGWLVLVLFL